MKPANVSLTIDMAPRDVTVVPARVNWSRPAAALVILVALVTPVLTALPMPAAGSDAEPRAFNCSFRQGTSRTYAKGRYKTRRASALVFAIESVDLEGQKAVLATPAGKGPLRIVRAVGANHYLEVVTEGYLNITTVYALDQQRRAHPAVHSRHVGLFGEPVVAQYVGFCRAVPSAPSGVNGVK